MYIYKITNNLNNKIYIGLKTKTVEESESYYGSGIAIKQAIKKYGKDNFTKTILERDITDYDYLCERERHYIDIYDAQENGYNITRGGKGATGYKHSEETKRKRSESLKGRLLSEEHKRKISEILKSKNRKMTDAEKEHLRNINLGRKHGPASEERRRKLSEAHMGKTLTEEHKRNIGKAQKGKKVGPLSEEQKRKISEALKGRPLTEEQREIRRQNHRNSPILTCPHCGKQGKKSTGHMTRFHFDNCKHKNC